jgi:hypothetical protein
MEKINLILEEENLFAVLETKPENVTEIVESIDFVEITTTCTNYNL